MKTENQKGNLLITIILLVALAALVSSVVFIASTGIRNVGYQLSRKKALYIAEAGIQKAAWFLGTPTSEGGRGVDWRTSGTSESFGGGSFTIKVGGIGASDYILITSEGNYLGVSRTLQARYKHWSWLPPAFNYAVYWNNSDGSTDRLKFGGLLINVDVVGNCFLKGNGEVKKNSTVTGGKIYVLPGCNVIGSGTYSWEVMSNYPSWPSLNNSYYTSLISRYNSLIPANPAASYTFEATNKVITLEGQTVSFESITVENTGGKLTLLGSGELVSRGNIIIKGSLYVQPASGETIALIANGGITVSSIYPNSTLTYPGTHFYSIGDECKFNKIISGSHGSVEVNRAVIMSNKRVTLNWYGSRIQDNSIVYIPPAATGIKKSLELDPYVVDITFSTPDIFHGSVICDCDSTDPIVKFFGGGMQGIIYSRRSPVRMFAGKIDGSIVTDNLEFYDGEEMITGDVNWSPSFLPTLPPPGIGIESIRFDPPSWKEI